MHDDDHVVWCDGMALSVTSNDGMLVCLIYCAIQGFALVAITVGRRVIKKMERNMMPNTSRSMSLPSPVTAKYSIRNGEVDAREGADRAYGDELLHDRRLRHRYRKVRKLCPRSSRGE